MPDPETPAAGQVPVMEEQLTGTEQAQEQVAATDEAELGEEIEEELIIEDFTIDGICGVY